MGFCYLRSCRLRLESRVDSSHGEITSVGNGLRRSLVKSEDVEDREPVMDEALLPSTKRY